MKYEIKTIFSENNHKIEETWLCDSLENMKKTLIEVLDILKDENGNAKEPDLEILKGNLGKYTYDENFIEKEYERLKRNYKTYCYISECFWVNSLKIYLEDNFSIEVNEIV